MNEQLEIELEKPNTGVYRFPGDLRSRNGEHLKFHERVGDGLGTVIEFLESCREALATRWSVWPETSDVEY